MPVCFFLLNVLGGKFMAESSNSKFVKLRCTKCKNEQGSIRLKDLQRLHALYVEGAGRTYRRKRTKVKSRILEVLE
jgi:phage FluMu protein Com